MIISRRLKEILGIVLAIVIIALAFVRISYFQRGYTRLMDFYGYEKNSMDMVVVGTSVTFSTYIPMQMWEKHGIASCDYCTNVMFENAMRYSIRDVLKTQSPKLIMVDIAPFFMEAYAANKEWSEEWREQFIPFNIDSRKYSLDRLCLVKEINEDIGGDWSSFANLWFDISRYHADKPVINELRFNNASDENEARGYGYLNRMGGEDLDRVSLMLGNSVLEDGMRSSNSECEDGIPLSVRSRKYLDLLIEEVKKTEAKTDTSVVFYCAPIWFDSEDELLRKKYVEETLVNNGITYYDLSGRAQDFDVNTDYWGHDHLDYLGAEKATDLLYEEIISQYQLPDRRQDEKYGYWYEDYDKWLLLKDKYSSEDYYRIENDKRL